ncbi:glycosyltransferase family 8 protein [Elizabethkingia anophelis]|uniref:glycosyltransferase family 8 protein n=1 Tax=Elizabethkingia anophelis TaxID=1117645 RepID=UPI0004E3829D|nr:glycosyltransferase family 8 protein [Elizabethkingia anophelis]KFC39648.1 stress protein [Elizabethkingia anophelis]MCT3720733.1 glycosyltransferase family 8 protein [Elizabethkingia anophelis]MCT3724121.1 glycosyltransferase family 8 protein [Elizabethkingia anophelis]MCT3756463.1 glycosyltransferase family 8 protein [Elizabethkingia anophelis]MCT3777294.1 glycosyltransferase family 8 protein [Elizabethkingia anophelis]
MLLSEVPIVLAFTPNYFVPAATCLYSILKHSAETENFHVICLLTEELPQQMKDKLQRLGSGRIRYSYIDLNGKLQGIYVDDRYTIAASYRLLLPDLLPEYNKVMYIDCDVIVRNNLYKLYQETDLGNNYLAAVFEASLDFQIPYIMSIGCEPGRYINSGFLIMNLEKLRKENMVAKFLEAARVEGLQFPDQDVLNQLCKGYILGLPPYYNGIRTFFLPQYKEYFLKYYSEENWHEVQQHGTIHYTGTKPWNSFTIGFNVWWEYYEHLPQEIKSEWVINRKIFVLHKLSNTVLGNLFITSLQSVYRKLKRNIQ